MINDDGDEEEEEEEGEDTETDVVADTLTGPTEKIELPGGEATVLVVILSLTVLDKLGVVVSTASVVKVTDSIKLEDVSSDTPMGNDEMVGATTVLKPGNTVNISEELPINTVASV